MALSCRRVATGGGALVLRRLSKGRARWAEMHGPLNTVSAPPSTITQW